MLKNKIVVLLSIFLLALSACQSDASNAVEPTSTPVPTLEPTLTLTPTIIPSPTIVPTPTTSPEFLAAVVELESRGIQVTEKDGYLVSQEGGRKVAVAYENEWLVIPEDTEDWHIPADAEILLLDSGPGDTEIPVVFGAGARVYKYENDEWISDLSEVDMPQFKVWVDQLAVEQLGEGQVPSPQISSLNEDWYSQKPVGSTSMLENAIESDLSYVGGLFRYEGPVFARESTSLEKVIAFHSVLDKQGNRMLFMGNAMVDGRMASVMINKDKTNYVPKGGDFRSMVEELENKDVAIRFFIRNSNSSFIFRENAMGTYYWQEYNGLTKAEFDDKIEDFQNDISKLIKYLWSSAYISFSQDAYGN